MTYNSQFKKKSDDNWHDEAIVMRDGKTPTGCELTCSTIGNPSWRSFLSTFTTWPTVSLISNVVTGWLMTSLKRDSDVRNASTRPIDRLSSADTWKSRKKLGLQILKTRDKSRKAEGETRTNAGIKRLVCDTLKYVAFTNVWHLNFVASFWSLWWAFSIVSPGFYHCATAIRRVDHSTRMQNLVETCRQP